MSLLAYKGDTALKVASLERLDALAADKKLISRPIFWDGEQGSLVGALVQGDDLDRWEKSLGLPKWLALAVDGLMASAPSMDDALSAGLGVMRDIAPGADLSHQGSLYLAEVLEDVEKQCADAELQDVARKIAETHRRAAAGDKVEAAEWRRLRKHAVALTDRLGEGSGENAIEAGWARCVEGAAWDPMVSRSVVSDTRNAWVQAMAAKKLEKSSLPPEEVEDIKKTLGELHKKAVEALPPGEEQPFIDVFKLLEEHAPEKAAKVQADNRLRGQVFPEVWRQSRDLITPLLRRETADA